MSAREVVEPFAFDARHRKETYEFRSTWLGGDFQLTKMGPKEAEIDIVAWTIASSTYVHHSMRGVLEGVAAPFCTKVYARELAERSGGTSMAFRIAWV